MQRQQIASEWLLKYITLGLICLLHIASVHWKKKYFKPLISFTHSLNKQFKYTIRTIQPALIQREHYSISIENSNYVNYVKLKQLETQSCVTTKPQL